MTRPRTATVPGRGAVLTYDVHGEHRGGTPLMLIGSPMAAGHFAGLAAEFTDRPVLTYDPRGCERSTVDDPRRINTPEDHAADLQRVLDAAGVERADVFASSGGAINALAWVVAGGPLRTVVAHEPPLYAVLPDRAYATAVAERMYATYDREGFGPAMAQFLTLVAHRGPFTAADLTAPAPDPAAFGLPTADNGDRTDPLLWQNRPCIGWQPDLVALRDTPTRLVLGIGEKSRDIVTGRTTTALADRLGLSPSVFPGGHAGFLAEDGSGMGGDPADFAAHLRAVLAG
ncbi:alpha/beta hydrolase [Mycobacterium sp. 1274756.6]|uniref:alpha/beta hydrolase n=1 Tax=Mycobacterium sp. 1274756.6 TaxID=1834076 RepID=UPI0007FD67B8|nr:alpha/beta hydrolase [Mycobacterium sp. 1274756.6]OBJ72160.1 hypothetical protein A5643_06050 [Mycobacterium sp. 1274756.6]